MTLERRHPVYRGFVALLVKQHIMALVQRDQLIAVGCPNTLAVLHELRTDTTEHNYVMDIKDIAANEGHLIEVCLHEQSMQYFRSHGLAIVNGGISDVYSKIRR